MSRTCEARKASPTLTWRFLREQPGDEGLGRLEIVGHRPVAGEFGAGARADVRRHVAPWIAGLAPRASRWSACLYTVVDEGDFLVDRSSPDGSVVLISARSGHGFKHAAAIGEAVATRVISPDSLTTPACFRLGRLPLQPG